jgi:NTP pyrophosphatase (non-canonical NTP hydrolase)
MKMSDEGKDFMPEYNTFLYPFRAMQFVVHELAVQKGWYDGKSERNPLELLALIVEEFGEAVHAVRNGSPESKKIPGYSCLEEELADIVIRVMDAAEHHQVRLADAIVAKHEYNKTRPERHGGKLY